MSGYLILGAGKFGRLALRRLSRQEAVATFLVVDRDPEALAAAKALEIPGFEGIVAEAGAFLSVHLREDGPWDWLIPMAPVHVAWAWLLNGPLRGWETAAAPEAVGGVAPVSTRGSEGQLYLSRAAHLCPDDCPEPDSLCPVSGENREAPLYEALANLTLPGWAVRVLASRQLAPGVGGYPPRELLALGRELAGMSGPVLIATACRCHGVVSGLKR
jgi:TrkA-N domain